MEAIFSNPIFAALFGWLAFNVILFSIKKDSFDDRDEVFPLRQYMGKVWDNWLASLLMIPILVYIGANKLNIDIDALHLQWNDLYYPMSGFATELVVEMWKKWNHR